MMKDLRESITQRLKGARRITLVGIGEEKLTDDGVGPYVISELLAYSNENIQIINAGIDPMTRTAEIINFKPTHLVLFDTCTLKEKAGTIILLERENICNYVPISTHTIPIHIVIDLILERLPDLRMFMIGFVPESLEGFNELVQYKQHELTIDDLSSNIDLPFFEINLTEKVKQSADQIIGIFKELISRLK
jgi:hydrogenase maturation protease